MERELLRKVQLTQLEIAKEIRRVCEENDIPYFLTCGTLLGAVRHQGFIPWDDDMDVGMLRENYEKFCRIAPEKLKPEYCWQTWYTDPNYALPFGKVRKRGTLYLEAKSHRLAENGFYVDIFPYDAVSPDAEQRQETAGRLLKIYRTKLMKSHYQPWRENEKILWKKRIGYLYYQALALFTDQESLAKAYDTLATALPENGYVCALSGKWHLGDSIHPQHGFSRWFTIARGGCAYYHPDLVEDGRVVQSDRYITDLITEDALKNLQDFSESEDPFCLCVHYTAPHAPWSPEHHPKEFLDLYRDCPFESTPDEPLHPWLSLIHI